MRYECWDKRAIFIDPSEEEVDGFKDSKWIKLYVITNHKHLILTYAKGTVFSELIREAKRLLKSPFMRFKAFIVFCSGDSIGFSSDAGTNEPYRQVLERGFPEWQRHLVDQVIKNRTLLWTKINPNRDRVGLRGIVSDRFVRSGRKKSEVLK